MASDDSAIERKISLSFYPWQDKQRLFLLEQKKQERLPHAILLAGNQFLGKFDFSTAIAGLLLCESLLPAQMQACGQCHSCRLLKNVTHPDFCLIEPEKDKSNIGIEAIRHLGDFVTKTSQRDGRRVVIIYPAENMTTAAANALLKRLEEPGLNLHFFLVSHAAEKLLPTVRSRCQTLLFSRPSASLVLGWLQQQLGNTGNENILLEDAGGSPLLALANASDLMYQNRKDILDNLDALLNKEAAISSLLSRWKDYSASRLLACWYGWLLDVLKLHSGASISCLQHKSVSAVLQNFADSIPSVLLLPFMDKLAELRNKLEAGVPINRDIMLESLLIEWSSLPGKKN